MKEEKNLSKVILGHAKWDHGKFRGIWKRITTQDNLCLMRIFLPLLVHP